MPCALAHAPLLALARLADRHGAKAELAALWRVVVANEVTSSLLRLGMLAASDRTLSEAALPFAVDDRLLLLDTDKVLHAP